VGVFLAYVSEKGRSLVDQQLFLPQAWARNKKRRKEAQVPKEVRFRTKPQIALQMIEHAHQGALPFRWVCCDDMYGNSGPLRDGVEALGLFYVAEVPSRTTAWTNKPPVREPGQGPCG
jgi:SRSO17 transposase